MPLTTESGAWTRIPTDDIPMGPPQRPPKAPFPAPYELIADLNTEDPSSVEDPRPLPGHIRINLNDPTELSAFLLRELYAKDLDVIVSKSWGMSAKSRIISPLHLQLVKGRKIYITEDPRLHLVWLSDRIFIKPLPKYLMSHRFWVDYLLDDSSALAGISNQKAIREAAMGFLRSYYHLIQHESDFIIASSDDLRLLPPNITYEQFTNFSTPFNQIDDQAVWKRYHYGELNLSTLDLHAKFFLRKLHYESIPGTHSSRFYAALLFGFAAWSLVLGAMQVVLAVEGLVTDATWDGFWTMCRWFGMITLVGCIILAILIGVILFGGVATEWIDVAKSLSSRKNRRRRKAEGSRV